MLSVAEYGLLATLFSIQYVFTIFSESIQTIITKFSSSESNPGRLKSLFKKSASKSAKFSILILVAYLLLSVFFSSLLNINYWLLSLNGLMILATFFTPLSRGIMQGRKKFFSLGFSMILEAIIKLSMAILLVYIGWRVYGAILAVFIGALIAFLYSLSSIKDILKSREITAKTQGIYSYTRPVFFITFSILLFYSLDVIIARSVFSPETAGFYAISSTIAKTIFFGTHPISRALFPLSAEKTDRKKSRSLFINALSILVICVIAALLIFYLFPDLLVRIFAGRAIPQSASILFFVAVGTSILSITNLILLYKLSINKITNYWIFLLFIPVEAILLYSFSASLIQFSLAFITSTAMFLWGSVVLPKE